MLWGNDVEFEPMTTIDVRVWANDYYWRRLWANDVEFDPMTTIDVDFELMTSTLS